MKDTIANDFNYYYKNSEYYFGEKPSSYLVKYINKYNIPPCIAIDLGAGEGRDSIYLAENGFDVIAIEPCIEGIKKIQRSAKAKNLEIETINSDFLSISESLNDVGLISCFTSLDHMDTSYLLITISEIKRILNKFGYVFITAYTQKDPGYSGTNNVSDCYKFVKHFFEEDELANYFSDFNILEYELRTIWDKSHGTPHEHSFVSMLANKI